MGVSLLAAMSPTPCGGPEAAHRLAAAVSAVRDDDPLQPGALIAECRLAAIAAGTVCRIGLDTVVRLVDGTVATVASHLLPLHGQDTAAVLAIGWLLLDDRPIIGSAAVAATSHLLPWHGQDAAAAPGAIPRLLDDRLVGCLLDDAAATPAVNTLVWKRRRDALAAARTVFRHRHEDRRLGLIDCAGAATGTVHKPLQCGRR
jgi:hypothetical protein